VAGDAEVAPAGKSRDCVPTAIRRDADGGDRRRLAATMNRCPTWRSRCATPAPELRSCTAGGLARPLLADSEHPSPEFAARAAIFYIPAGEVGFWQAAFRDRRPAVRRGEEGRRSRQPVDDRLLYGDHRAGSGWRALQPAAGPRDRWIASASRHHTWTGPTRGSPGSGPDRAARLALGRAPAGPRRPGFQKDGPRMVTL